MSVAGDTNPTRRGSLACLLGQGAGCMNMHTCPVAGMHAHAALRVIGRAEYGVGSFLSTVARAVNSRCPSSRVSIRV